MREKSRLGRAVLCLDARISSSARWAWWATFLMALLVYGVTAHWNTGQITDAIVASWPGWHFVHTGRFDLAGVDLPQFPGLVEMNDRVVVARSMGVILAGIPGSALLVWANVAPEVGGALSAVLMTSVAVANVGVALRSLVPTRVALAATAVLALGTGLWTIASAELWGHGPNAFWLSFVLLAISRQRWWWAGAAMAPAILTRPHLAVAAAVLGLWLGGSGRTVRPVVAIGIPSLLAVAVLQRWNTWYFGSSALDAGYGYAVNNATRGPLDGIGLWAENLAGVLLSPMSGVLLYSPVLLTALVAVVRHRKQAPGWTRALAAAGVAYVIIQMRISPSFDGGASYYGNRYTVECLVLATPLMTFCLYRWAAGWASRTRTIALLASSSIGIHLYGAVLVWWWVPITPRSSWVVWYPYDVATYAGAAAAGAALAAVGLVALTMAVLRSREDSWEEQRREVRGASALPEQRSSSSAAPAPPPGAAASPRR